MKVYIVTSGCYSDYGINKVFLDRQKADEYKEWLRDSNDIEEYDTEDDVEFKKYYKIHISCAFLDDGTNRKPDIYIHKEICDYAFRNATYYSNSYDYASKPWKENGFYITMKRYIEASNWDEEFYVNKYEKALYDLAAIVKYHRANGVPEQDIRMLFNDYKEDE